MLTHLQMPHGTQGDHQQLPEPTSTGASSHRMTFLPSCPSLGGVQMHKKRMVKPSSLRHVLLPCKALTKQLVEHELE